MTTFIVVPRVTRTEVQTAIRSGDQEQLASAEQAQASALFPQRSETITVASSLYLGTATDRAPAQERTEGVQVLDALNILLVDDLTREERESLGETADVLENVQIDMVAPVEAGTEENGLWHLSNICVNAAREKGLTGNGVRIGILDTGIDASHREFSGKDISFMEFDANGFPVSTTPRDAGEHGTHVAGIAAGRNCGVAPEADLAVAAVLTQPNNAGQLSGYLAQILGGFNWLVSHNHASGGGISKCPVVNASLGVRGYRDYLYSSVETQHTTLRSSLMVAAIGNCGSFGVNNHGSPGNYDLTVGVGAVDGNRIAARFSDWGIEKTHMALQPDLCAPGVTIRSAVPDGGYASKSGTSMACPVVAGASALLIEQQPAYARRPASLKQALLRLVDSTTVGNPANNGDGYSRIGSGSLDLTGI